MRKLFALLMFSSLVFSAQAQIISEFTWDANPVTLAAIGPNGTSANSTATSSTGGNGGTNGLNAGTGGNINLIVPGSTFQIPGIDISIDFNKQENGASFFTLGNFDFGISTGAIYVKLPLTTGLQTFNSILAVPATGWHTYRIIYNNTTGVFTASVDGSVNFTYNAPAGTAINWAGATNVTIGGLMDGSGSNKAELDNLIVQSPNVVLPLQLLSFDAINDGNANKLSWTAAQEEELLDYTVERSTDGAQFTAAGTIAPRQDHTYTFTDNTPAATSYYRLKLTSIDGTSTYSGVKKVSLSASVSVTCYPNPVVDYANIRFNHAATGSYRYTVLQSDGHTLQSGVFELGNADQQISLNLSTAPKGILFIRVQGDDAVASTFEVLRK
jgi:Secretion system C-terminal sorting domain